LKSRGLYLQLYPVAFEETNTAGGAELEGNQG
jgi:hypothetical protein